MDRSRSQAGGQGGPRPGIRPGLVVFVVFLRWAPCLVESGHRPGRDATPRRLPPGVRLDVPLRPFAAVLDRCWDRRLIPLRLSPDRPPRPYRFVALGVRDAVPVCGSLRCSGSFQIFRGVGAWEIPDQEHERYREIQGLGG